MTYTVSSGTLSPTQLNSSKVKGHGAIQNPLAVCYMISIVSNIASLTAVEIFDVQVL